MEDIKIERLKEIVKEKGWTQKRIAEECGYTQQYISYLLNGTKPIGVDCATAIGKVLGVNPDYILGISEFKNDKDYWIKASGYHASVEAKLIELLELLEIEISYEPYTIERTEKRIDTKMNTISEVVTERSQAIKVKSPRGERIFTEMELYKLRDDLVKSIIDKIG